MTSPSSDQHPPHQSRLAERALRLPATTSVLVVPASDYRPATHPHLVTVPIADAEPTHVVVASRATDNNPSLDAFRSAAAATLAAAA